MEISLERLSKIFSSAFEGTVVLELDSTKENVELWDSLKHLHLVLELEDELNVQFTTSEIEQMVSVRKLLEILKSK